MEEEKIFFPNLNGLRFIAASMVLVHHSEFALWELKLPSTWTGPGLGLIGGLGVSLFFTLSGFLITYLLLTEKKKTGTISLKKFYLRRILRIWPLYYFIVLLGLFVLPRIPFMTMPGTEYMHLSVLKKILLFALILPNVVSIIWSRLPYLSQTWSIGVEEQFYFIWPLMIKTLRRPLPILVLIYIAFTLFSIYSYAEGIKWFSWVSFGCISAGSVGAYLLFHNIKWFVQIAHSHITFALSLIFSFLLFYSNAEILHLQEFFGVFFMFIIVYLASAPRKIVNLNYKWLDYLGSISYGIYMYHNISIGFIIRFLQHIGVNEYPIMNIIVCIFTFIVSIFIASLSYKYFEKPFLKLKKRFEIINTSNRIKQE